MPLLRFEVKNEYGLGDPELYRGAVKREEPKAVLDGVAVAGLVGILRQLGDLSEFAADIFHDLHEQIIATSARGRKVTTRVKNIESALPSLEKAIRGQTSHIHLAYIPGCEWHARMRTEKSHLLSSDLPRFMMDSYEECRDPPRLYLLDKFDNGGPGASLKRYSDPTFFEKAWDMLTKVKNAENGHKEKKYHKVKRKGSRTRNGDLHNAPNTSQLRNGAFPEMLIASQHNSQRFASPSPDTHSLSENRSIPDTRSNPDLISRSTSLGSKSRFSLIEQVTDPDPVSAPSMLPNETAYPSSSSVKHDETDRDYYSNGVQSSSSVKPEEKNRDYYSNGVPVNVPLSPPRSITWDEKAAIVATTSTVYCDDVMMDRVHVDPMFVNQDISPDSKKLPMPLTLVTANHEEVGSETENYVDALNTLESETETETECHTKWEVNQFHDSGCKSDVKPITKSSEVLEAAPSDDLLASQRLAGNGNASMRQHESLQNSQFVSSEVFEINAASPNDGWPGNGDVSMREPQSEEVSESAPPEISSLVLNQGSFMNSQVANFQTSDYSRADSPERSKIAPADLSEHFVPLEANSVDLIEEPSVEDSPRVKIKPRNASRRYEFPQYSEIPPLAVSLSHTLPDQNIQSDIQNVETHIIDYPHTSTEEPRVTSTITAESVENEMQTAFSDVQTVHANGGHDTTTDESPIVEKDPFVNISSAKLWTNAGLFGLEPSKPPVFASVNGPMEEAMPHSVANGSMPNSNLSEVDEPLHGNSTMNGFPSHENKGNGTVNLSSSFSSLAQRFLTNTLQKRISSSPSSSIAYPEQSAHTTGVPSDARRSMQDSPSRHSTGQSSPPLEFMKISFHPMNGIPISNLDDGMNDDAVFPDFQIHPGPTRQPGDSGSESDEDTFCRSYGYSSEDLSPRLFSNSDVWDPDEIPDYSEKIALSAGVSGSSYMGFEQADLQGIETVSNLNRNLNPNFVSENENQMPPPPPLPPVQWRLLKPAVSMADANTSQLTSRQDHMPLPPPPSVPPVLFQQKVSRDEQEKLERDKEVNCIPVRQMKLDGEVIHWNREKPLQQKSNGHEKPKKDAFDTNDLDEREELLYQIRNKSFNLRRTVKSKPEPDSSETTTNTSVSAIIEKANAIRQAFVGSDDGCDDDSWSDT
ncbi:SCAR family protein [Rhynchospora pubera]|uniref:Protein SCAR n=1 Tax=Rhynchospora pubera TaxID=906938 RepID=A0AAV8C6A0_9POAL|nr:SCAR family protein [Rhynchospora pubera]